MRYHASRLVESKAERTTAWSERRAEIEAKAGASVDILKALSQAMAGTLVAAGDAAYDQARKLAGPTFQGFPIAIAECRTVGDVRQALFAARRAGWPFTCRSGGHSTAGYSVNDGLVIDLTGLSYVLVDPATRRVRAGAGTPFDVFTAALDSYGLHVVSGGCGDVCIGGFLQGGGYGFTSYAYGMHSDNAVSLSVMLADASEVVASPAENPDLFWAMRGGTGNNFGVLLEATYQARPIGSLQGFSISWPAAQAADALVVLQERYTRIEIPGLLGYMGMFAFHDGDAKLVVSGLVEGSADDSRRMLGPLLAVPGATPAPAMSGAYRDLDNQLTVLMCPSPLPKRGFKEEKQCGYVARALTRDEWQAIIDHYLSTPDKSNVFFIEPYGGAIAAVAPDASAFGHRDVSMDLVFEAIWYEDRDRAKAMAWLDEVRDRFGWAVNGHVYQNYPRRGLDDFRWRYWGRNFDTLLWVKQKYDPDDVFRFEQSVSPYPPGERRDGGPVLFSDPAITYRFRPAGAGS